MKHNFLPQLQREYYESGGSFKKIVGEDMICPETGKHCDDECCTAGSECNLSGGDLGISPVPAETPRPPLPTFTRGIDFNNRDTLLNLIEFTRNSSTGYGITRILDHFIEVHSINNAENEMELNGRYLIAPVGCSDLFDVVVEEVSSTSILIRNQISKNAYWHDKYHFKNGFRIIEKLSSK